MNTGKITSLGERIHYARNFQGFTKKDLAAKLEIPLPHLIDYEKGKVVSDKKALKEISRLCAFDLYWLETGENQYRSPSDD